jgi:hypothetical protein
MPEPLDPIALIDGGHRPGSEDPCALDLAKAPGEQEETEGAENTEVGDERRGAVRMEGAVSEGKHIRRCLRKTGLFSRM